MDGVLMSKQELKEGLKERRAPKKRTKKWSMEDDLIFSTFFVSIHYRGHRHKHTCQDLTPNLYQIPVNSKEKHSEIKDKAVNYCHQFSSVQLRYEILKC